MNKIKAIKPYLITLIAITVLTSVFLSLAFLYSFDINTGFFIQGSINVTVFFVLYVLGFIYCLTGLLLFPKKTVTKSDDSFGSAHKIILALLGTITILYGTISYFVSSEAYTLDTIPLIASVGIYGFGGYLLLISVMNGYKFSNFKLLCLILSIGLPAAMHITNNSNFAKPLSAPDNELVSILAAVFLVYIIYEGRRVHTGIHHRMHLVSASLVFFTGFATSSAYVLAFLSQKVYDESKFYQMIAVLLISLASLVELLRLSTHAVVHTEEEWAEIEAVQEQAQDNQPAVEENANETKEI